MYRMRIVNFIVLQKGKENPTPIPNEIRRAYLPKQYIEEKDEIHVLAYYHKNVNNRDYSVSHVCVLPLASCMNGKRSTKNACNACKIDILFYI